MHGFDDLKFFHGFDDPGFCTFLHVFDDLIRMLHAFDPATLACFLIYACSTCCTSLIMVLRVFYLGFCSFSHDLGFMHVFDSGFGAFFDIGFCMLVMI